MNRFEYRFSDVNQNGEFILPRNLMQFVTQTGFFFRQIPMSPKYVIMPNERIASKTLEKETLEEETILKTDDLEKKTHFLNKRHKFVVYNLFRLFRSASHLNLLRLKLISQFLFVATMVPCFIMNYNELYIWYM